MELTTARLNAVYLGFNTAFKEGLHGDPTRLQSLALDTKSTSEKEAYEWLNTIGNLVEFGEEGVFDDLTTSGYEIKNREFQRGVSVKALTIKRDREGILSPVFTQLGARANSHKDVLIAELVTGGFAQKDYTGKNFFDTTKKHQPNVSKKLKAPTFTNKGTAVLDKAAFEAALLNLKSRTDTEGTSLGLGKKLVLVVGTAAWVAARDIVELSLLAAGGNNPNYQAAELILMPEIDSSDNVNAWFLFETGMPLKPLIFQDEVPVTLTSQTGPESDHVFEKQEFRYQAYGSRGAGYGLPQLAYGSTGAGA